MTDIAPQQDPAPRAAQSTDMKVGDILRRTREHYGRTIDEVEAALRIRASQVEALENNNSKGLPGRVYAIGFVRSYSEYLGLDGDKMVELFKSQSANDEAEPELHFPAPPSDGYAPPLWVMAGCAVVAILLLTFWFGQNNENRAIVEDIPPVPEALQTAVAPEPEPEPETPVIEEKPKEGIILNIRKNSWIEIRDKKGNTMLSRVLKAGDQYFVPDRPDLTISIGNAAGVEVEVNGQKLRQLGGQGKVLRRLPLDAKYLQENFALE